MLDTGLQGTRLIRPAMLRRVDGVDGLVRVQGPLADENIAKGVSDIRLF